MFLYFRLKIFNLFSFATLKRVKNFFFGFIQFHLVHVFLLNYPGLARRWRVNRKVDENAGFLKGRIVPDGTIRPCEISRPTL